MVYFNCTSENGLKSFWLHQKTSRTSWPIFTDERIMSQKCPFTCENVLFVSDLELLFLFCSYPKETPTYMYATCCRTVALRKFLC